MKTRSLFCGIAMLSVCILNPINGVNAQTGIPRDEFTVGNNSVNLTQMRDGLCSSCVHGSAGSQTIDTTVRNRPRVIPEREESRASLERWGFEQTPLQFRRFLLPPLEKADTSLVRGDVTIYFYGKDLNRLRALGIMP